MTVLGATLMVANGQPVLGTFDLDEIIVGIAYAAVGGLLASRVPENRIGWVFLAAAWIWGLDLLVLQIAWAGAAGSLALAGFGAWLSNWIWIPGNVLLLFAVPVLFPDGHLPSPRWRPVAIAVIAAVMALTVGQAAVALQAIDDPTALLTSFDASASPGLAGLLVSLGQLFVFLLVPWFGLLAVVLRYRSSRGVARQQMRWFTLAISVLAVTVVLDQIAGQIAPWTAGLISAIGLVFLPLALAIAILRYRLYEIDRIISRTIAYGLMTGLLAALFVAAILLFQAILAPVTGGSTVGVAASTLVVAAVFQPLRQRVQQVVDGRFNRSRYDAERVLETFSGQLRDQVDLAELRLDVLDAVDEALRPGQRTLWLRGGGR